MKGNTMTKKNLLILQVPANSNKHIDQSVFKKFDHLFETLVLVKQYNSTRPADWDWELIPIEYDAQNANAYLVQQWNSQTSIWEIAGIFDNKQAAIEACRDESYIIGEFERNKQMPHQSVDGIWYNHRGELIQKNLEM